MTQVHQLTPEQAELLTGQQYAPDSYFNPIQDANGNWVISIEEVSQSNIEWLKEAPLIEYMPVPPETIEF
jgi:hypothetical protein